MAKISYHIDDDYVGVVNDRSRRWNSLLELSTLLSQGKAVLEELVGEIESPNLLAALDRGFLKKRKRSPRNPTFSLKESALHINPNSDLVASQVESPNNFLVALDRGFLKKRKRSPRNHNNCSAKPRICDDQTPETSSGGDCDQSPKSTLCPNFNFEKSAYPADFNKKRKRGYEFDVEISPGKSKRRQLMDRHIIDSSPKLQPPLPEAIRARIIETGGRLEGAIEKALFPTNVGLSSSFGGRTRPRLTCRKPGGRVFVLRTG